MKNAKNLNAAQANVWIQNSIALSGFHSAPEPDVALLKPKSYFNELPIAEDVLLVIEVSDSSLTRDQGEKASLYAQAGIRDYWIVNIPDWCVEVYRDSVGETFQSVTKYDSAASVSPLAFPNVKLAVGELFQT